MTDESRLDRALAASAAPKRDNAFVLAVLERAEQQRFRRATLQSALRGAGVTSAAAALLAMLANWASAQQGAVTEGVLWAGALVALIGLARALAARLRSYAA